MHGTRGFTDNILLNHHDPPKVGIYFEFYYLCSIKETEGQEY